MRVVARLLKEPTFSTLRTKEQLGYIVSAVYDNRTHVCGLSIKVQSSKYGPEYLEWRINEFLNSKLAEGFTDDEVETVKKALIQSSKQVHMNLI